MKELHLLGELQIELQEPRPGSRTGWQFLHFIVRPN